MGDRDLRSHCRVGKMRATFAERGTTTAVVSLNRIELVFLKLSGLTLLGVGVKDGTMCFYTGSYNISPFES